MVSKEGPGGGPREAIPGGVMGGRRACVLTKRSQGAVEGAFVNNKRLGKEGMPAMTRKPFLALIWNLDLPSPECTYMYMYSVVAVARRHLSQK